MTGAVKKSALTVGPTPAVCLIKNHPHKRSVPERALLLCGWKGKRKVLHAMNQNRTVFGGSVKELSVATALRRYQISMLPSSGE